LRAVMLNFFLTDCNPQAVAQAQAMIKLSRESSLKTFPHSSHATLELRQFTTKIRTVTL
jgi:hypothetical protein